MDSKTRRESWIDAARGIAMLMVISVHLSQCVSWLHQSVFSFGAMGVQLFFLLSGYCLCMKTTAVSGWRNFCELLARRYRRLAPWYLIGIVVYAIYWWIVGNSSSLENYTLGNVLANIMLINALFPSAQNTIVPGGWSISCIALFSFVYPLFVDANRGVRIRSLAIVSIVGLMLACLGYVVFGLERQFIYCSLLNQFAVFTIGVAFYMLQDKLRRMKVWHEFVLAFVCFALAAVAVLFDREYAILYRHLLMALSFAFGLMLWMRADKWTPRWLVWTGRHSYEIFIMHFAVLWALLRRG